MAKDYEAGVLRALETAFEKRKREIFARAQREIRAIQEEAEAQRQRVIQKRLQKLKQQMAVRRARELGLAHRDAREEILEAKYAVVHRIEQRVRERLKQLGPDAWRRVLQAWLREVLPYVQEAQGKVVVRVPQGYRSLVEQELRAQAVSARVEVQEAPDLDLGVVLEDQDRGFRVQNTLEERFQRARTLMLEKVAALLEAWEGES